MEEFLGGLNDKFENVKSEILNSGNMTSIVEVYAQVEVEEQR